MIEVMIWHSKGQMTPVYKVVWYYGSRAWVDDMRQVRVAKALKSVGGVSFMILESFANDLF
jgi:hypothetical protein